MNTVIKTTVGIIAISMAAISAAQAGERHERGYEKPRHERHFRDDDRRHHWKYQAERKHDRKYRGDRYVTVIERPRWKNAGKKVVKHVYHDNGYRRVEKHVYHYRPAPRVIEKRVIVHQAPAPRVRVVERVVVEPRHHHGNPLPALAGGLIGSAIGNDLSHGDPAAAVTGAIFGAVIGNAIAHH